MNIVKRLIIFVIIFISGLLIFQENKAYAVDPYIPNCLGIEVKFYAQNWKGGPIEIGCEGDDGGAVDRVESRWCKGEVKTIRPNETKRLTKCSCFGKTGCLKIGKDLNLSRTLENGRYKITVVRRIDEMPEFTQNNCTRTRTGDQCGTNTDRIKPRIKIVCAAAPVTRASTPTPIPTGPISCPVPPKVTNVTVTCPDCYNSNLTPTVTLTPTGGANTSQN